ncbi:hypothetical protein SRIMM317S_03839 [Streptomyces rimosus subsp. rimosus]
MGGGCGGPVRPAGGLAGSGWALRGLGHDMGTRPAGFAARRAGHLVYRGYGGAAHAARRQGRPRGGTAGSRGAVASDATYEAALGLRFAGRREREVGADITRLLTGNGHEAVAFVVVGSGPDGADPQHEAGERVIEDGDMVVLDFARPEEPLLLLHRPDRTRRGTAVRRGAQGVRGRTGGAAGGLRGGAARARPARRSTGRPGGSSRRRVTGSTSPTVQGRGIGSVPHEPPYLVEGEQLPLVPGMCFSIEPGIYPSGAVRRADRGRRDVYGYGRAVAEP